MEDTKITITNKDGGFYAKVDSGWWQGVEMYGDTLADALTNLSEYLKMYEPLMTA